LIAANIHSAPVYENDKCIGLVDLCDVVAFLAHTFYKKADIHADGEAALNALATKSFSKDDMSEGKGMNYRFTHQTVKELIDCSKQNPFKSIPMTASLNELMRTLAGVRRVPVVDAAGNVVALISQSTVVMFMADHHSQLSISSKTLEELSLARKHVFTIPSSARAIDAFARLHEQRISAIAITDQSGKMIGNVSLKDVQFAVSDVRHLLMPVFDYVNAIRRENLFTRNPTMSCHPTDTFGSILQRFKAVKVHRFYIQSAGIDVHPIGIISVSDILKVLAASGQF